MQRARRASEMAQAVLYQWSINIKIKRIQDRYEDGRPISINIGAQNYKDNSFDINISRVMTQRTADDDYDYHPSKESF